MHATIESKGFPGLKVLLLVCVLVGSGVAQAQTTADVTDEHARTLYSLRLYGEMLPALQRPISINLEGVSFARALREIARQGHFELIYSPDLVPEAKLVSVKVERGSVAEALRAIAEHTDLRVLISPRNEIVLVRKAIPDAVPARRAVALDVGSARKLVPAKLDLLRPRGRQTGTITGTVTDAAKGETLPGVNVVIEGTARGAATDANGTYTIAGVEPGTYTLAASFVGYADAVIEGVDVTDGGTTVVNFALEAKVVEGEEVVVIGYGTQERENLTGAVSSVSADEVLESRPITSLAEGLQGVIPNLNISFGSGEPGREASFNIRGATSINGGSPLILVDGVAMDPSMINPANIESITVLKDAASAAIYGGRAAFGVILISTKDGQRGQPITLHYSNNIAWNTPTRVPDIVNSWHYAQSINQALFNDGGVRRFTDEELEKIRSYYKNPTGSCETIDPSGNYSYYCNTDWVDAMFQNFSSTQKHTLSVSGGSERTSFYASGGYLGQHGILTHGNDTYGRYNLFVNVDADVADWMRARFKVAYNRGRENSPRNYDNIGSYWYAAYRMLPIVPVRHDDDTWAWEWNPIAYLEDGGRVTSTDSDLWITLENEVRLGGHIILKGDFTFNPYYQSYKSHRKTVRIQRTEGEFFTGFSAPNWAYEQIFHNRYYAANVYGEYENTFAEKHAFEVLLGTSREWKTYEYYYARGRELISNNIPSLNLSTGEQEVGSGYNAWAIQSVFFRLNYNYDGRYLLMVNGRLDGTSRFPEGRRYGVFPSMSAGWRISEEAFWEGIDFIDDLKLRVSYGSLGNQDVANFGFIPIMGVTPRVNYIFGEERPVGVYPPGLVSNDRTWETVTTYNIGLDLVALSNRLNLTFDWYTRETEGMLVDVTYPPVLGTSAPRENGANLRTRGWGLRLSWDDFVGEFQYGLFLALSDHHAVITEFDNPTGSLANYYEGMALGEIWGYTTVGLFQNEEEVEGVADQTYLWGGNWGPGDVRYKDLNGDGLINLGDYTVDNPGDLSVIGNSTPRYAFGIRGNVGWKGFDASFFFQGVGKRDLMLGGALFWGYTSSIAVITEEVYHNSWSKDNRDAYYPILKTGAPYNNQTQTRYLQNGAYIRLKALTIGYTLPNSITNALRLKDARVYVSGQNLWEYTPLVETFDPEGTGGSGSPGLIYPFQRSYSIGMNLTF